MKAQREEQLRAADLRRQRLQEAQEAAQQRREKLLLDVEELAAASRDNPAAVGEYVGELAAAGLLAQGDEQLLHQRVADSAGSEFASQAFSGGGGHQKSESDALLGALADEWRSARGRIERSQTRGNVIDVDAKRAQKTMELVERIAGFLGLPERDIRVQADEVAATKTDARGASGLMDDGVVYLNPRAYNPETESGRYLLGHEMVHMAQRQEGAGRGLTISKPGAEAEAASLGRMFATAGTLSKPKFGLPAMDRAADTDAATSTTSQTGTAASSSGPPEDFKLSLAGQQFRIRIPSGASPGRVDVSDLSIAVGPLTITSAELNFKPDWGFDRGKVTATVNAGEGINIDNVELDVNSELQVSAVLENVEVELGSYMSATMNLTISSRGVSGTATIQPGDVNLPGGISFTGGEITLTVADGSMSASGTVTAAVAGLGQLELAASVSQGGEDAAAGEGGASVSGSVNIELEEDIQLSDGISLKSAKISGSYDEAKGYEVSGKVGVVVDGWGKADIEVGYKRGIGGGEGGASEKWTAKGRLEQEKGTPLTVGSGENALTVTDGHLEIDYTDNELKHVGAGGTFDHKWFNGTFEGDYKVVEKQFTGKGDATLKQPITVGEGEGALTIHEAAGGATIVENKFTEVRIKSARADVPYEGQKTFEIHAKDAVYKIPEKDFTGSGSVKTLRELTFGDTAKQHVKIASGAKGAVEVKKNAVTAINGGIAFSVREAESELGNGSVSLDFQNKGGTATVSGKGEFTLSTDYGYPDREKGPLIVKSGGTLKVELEKNNIKEVQVKGLKFEVTNPLEGKGGKISGALDGTMNFSTGMLDATAQAAVDETWSTGAEWGEVEFTKGGNIKLTVVKSELTEFDGQMEFKAVVPGPSAPIQLSGQANGKYAQKTGVFDGSIDAKLENTIEVPQDKGAKVVVKKDAKVSATVTGGQLTEIGVDVDLEYYRDGAKMLTGEIKGGKYNIPEKALTFDGRAKLHQDIEKATEDGGWKLIIKKDAEIDISVEANVLKRLGGNVAFEIFEGAEKLAEGHLREADVKDGDYTGEFDVKLVKDFRWPGKEATPKDSSEKSMEAFLEIQVQKGSGFGGKVNKNVISEVEAKFDAKVKHGGELWATGKFDGEWKPTEDKFSCDYEFKTVRPLGSTREKAKMPAASADKIPAWGWLLPAGQEISGTVVDNAFQKAKVDLKLEVFGPEGPGQTVATASAQGEFDIAEDPTKSFEGDIDINVTKTTSMSDANASETDFEIWLAEGSSFKAKWTEGGFESANGDFKLNARQSGVDKIDVNVKGDWTPATGVNGSGTIKVREDFLISEAAPYKLWLKTESGGEGKVEKSAFTEVSGQLLLRLDKDTTEFANGTFEASYKFSEGKNAKIDAVGTAKLVGEIETTGPGSEYKYFVRGGASVELGIKQSTLDYFKGHVEGGVADKAEFINFNCEASYKVDGGFDANGNISVIKQHDLWTSGANKAYLKVGEGASFTVKDGNLVDITAKIPMGLADEKGELISVELNGTYTHADKQFNGLGTAKLARKLPVKEGVPLFGESYSFYIEPSSGFEAKIENNTFTHAKGDIEASLHDSKAKLITAKGNVTYAKDQGAETGKLTTDSSVEVLREKELVKNSAGGFKASITKQSGVKLKMNENKFESLEGTIQVKIQHKSKDLAQIDLVGSYTEADGFKGKGTAALLPDEIFVKEVGEYKLYVVKSKAPVAEITLENTDVTHIGGTVNGRIDDKEGKFIEMEVTADYLYTEEKFSGNGSAKIVSDRKLAETTTRTGPEELWLCKGTGATVEVSNNELQKVGGEIALELREGSDGTYVKVKLEGTFDAKGGDGFSGSGSVEVTRDKKLADINGYQFWLAKGTGASAKIEKNNLTEVTGKVPFKIFTPDDAKEPLLVGSCEGKYEAKTGLFNGSGDIRLGRDVEFELGGTGAKLVFKKGSGGDAVVEDNELRKLGGTLDVDIWDDEGALVNVKAEGEYNAVTNELVKVEGEAKLLRKMELLDGAIILHEAKGNALVEKNKLKSGHIEATIEVVPLNNMKGHVEVDFANEGNGFEVWGEGWVDFTLIEEDADTGRYMGGKLDLKYNRDNTFKIEGTADYKINHMIGGDVTVAVDQEMDPVIGANFNLSDVPLIKGKELFAKELDLVPKMTIPIFPPAALNMFFGVKGGAKLDLRPLLFSANIGFQNWRPLAEKAEVPDFAVDLALNWGMDFQAMVAAYMGLSLGVQGFSAGAGVEGQLVLDVPIEVAPHGRLEGGKKGFSGFLGIGVTIAPSLKAKAIPFVEADLGPLGFRHEFAEWEFPLGELFKWEWGTKYEFGDRPNQTKETPGHKAPQGTESKKSTRTEGVPSFPTKSSAADNVKGGPQLESGAEHASKAQEEKGSSSEMEQKLEDIKVLAEGIGAFAKLFEYLIGCLTALAMAGPAGLLIYLVIEIVFGDLSWNGVVSAVKAVVKAMKVAGRLLEPHLPDWAKTLLTFATAQRPNLLDALFGADDKAREEVRKGTHRELPPKGRAKFIDLMIDGWTGEADQECILTILQFSSSNGDISSVVRMVDGGADQILSDLDGREDREARRLFDRAGIRY